MNYPKALQEGSRVALIAPASGVSSDKAVREESVKASEEALRRLGLVPITYPSCMDSDGYLAAPDEVRAADVMDAFCDDHIDGIWCIRGGYGVQRILDRLDFDELKKHPKWFGGYSDITALHIALNQLSDMATWHIVMPSTEVAAGVDAYTEKYMKQALFSDMTGELPSAPSVRPYLLDRKAGASVKGVLCGGNLSLVSSSLGTPWEIDTKGKILFLEDIGEAIYRLDGMLNHMRLAGKFEDAAGIVLGYWSEITEKKDALPLERMISDLLPHDKPVLMNYSCGHERPTTALPLGRMAELSGAACRLTILPE